MMKDGTRVLVVDDDADIRELIKLCLEIDGYQVSLATDGLDAFRKLKDGLRPAMILLDLMMPRMDGERFLKEMRRTPFSTIPVVIMSGHTTALKKADVLQAACCLMKPVELSELLKTVRRFARCTNDAA